MRAPSIGKCRGGDPPNVTCLPGSFIITPDATLVLNQLRSRFGKPDGSVINAAYSGPQKLYPRDERYVLIDRTGIPVYYVVQPSLSWVKGLAG
jgi:hypothetical protein